MDLKVLQKHFEAWHVQERDFPQSGTVAEKLEFCVRYAVLAPSVYNNQPWYFIVENNTVSVCADRRYALPVIDPDDRQLTMNCGSALLNLRLAMRYFGLQEFTQILPNAADEDLIARVQVSDEGYQATEEEKQIFKAITRRQINRSVFKSAEVAREKIDILKAAAKQENAWFYVCEGDERDIIAHYIAEGDNMQMNNKSFRRELAAWINERRFASGDGEPDFARAYHDVMGSSRPRIVRRFEFEPGVVVQDNQIAAGCPVLAILGSERGGQANRIYAGQAFMRVLLQAEAMGLYVSTLNQPCEIPELRLRIHDEIEHYRGRAQYILRIGQAAPVVNYSPRRPLRSFLVRESEHVRPSVTPANDRGPGRKGPSFWARLQKLFLAK